MTLPGVSCQVVGCDVPTRTGREFDYEGRRIWLMVCAEHTARLDTGEAPVLVSRPFDLADADADRPSLIMDPRSP